MGLRAMEQLRRIGESQQVETLQRCRHSGSHYAALTGLCPLRDRASVAIAGRLFSRMPCTVMTLLFGTTSELTEGTTLYRSSLGGIVVPDLINEMLRTMPTPPFDFSRAPLCCKLATPPLMPVTKKTLAIPCSLPKAECPVSSEIFQALLQRLVTPLCP